TCSTRCGSTIRAVRSTPATSEGSRPRMMGETSSWERNTCSNDRQLPTPNSQFPTPKDLGLGVGSWKLGVGSWKLGVGSSELTVTYAKAVFLATRCAAAIVSTAAQAPAPAPTPQALAPTGGRGLTEVHGIKVGHHTLTERPTG